MRECGLSVSWNLLQEMAHNLSGMATEGQGVTSWLFELPLTVLCTDMVASIFSVP